MRNIKYNPFSPLKTVSFERMFDDVAGRSISEILGSNFTSSTPSVNVIEHDQSFDIMVAAPGLSKENFEINLDNEQLIISGKKEESKKEEESGKVTRREFDYQSFKRSFHVSDDISKSGISATYDKGILTVTLPKKEPVEDVKTKIDIT